MIDEKRKKELFDELSLAHDIIINSGEPDDVVVAESNAIYWLQRVLEVGIETAIARYINAMREYEQE